eukprot:TRINITY_DN14162_c0_g4_i1.p1 TRINITY_DN14162_c0_g4~~TRINITY_DN14162_c0_g4_i1.p1  ORF type:complete len:381 (+),score=35.26 TRINITY_DN14162_c0_g4_i1:53-1144(+)
MRPAWARRSSWTLKIIEFVDVRDACSWHATCNQRMIGEDAWAMILLRDFSERAPEHVTSIAWYRNVKKWRANAELLVEDIVTLPDADDVLAYMARHSYYPSSLDAEEEAQLQAQWGSCYESPTKCETDVLIAALTQGFVAALRELIAQGVNMGSVITRVNMQPLHMACRWGHLEIVQTLLLGACNVDVNAVSDDGQAALHYACESGVLDVVRFLVLEVDGAIIDVRTNNGEGPLSTACHAGHVSVARFLASEAVNDINERDLHQRTPLHHACYRGHVEVVSFLSACEGIDVNSIDAYGSTPHDIACKFGESLRESAYMQIAVALEHADGFIHRVSSHPSAFHGSNYPEEGKRHRRGVRVRRFG